MAFSNNLFDATEELALLKSRVIADLKDYLHLHSHYFIHAQKSRKFNPSKLNLENFTMDALLYVIQIMALTTPTQLLSILTPILMSNYNMSVEVAIEVIENMFSHRCDTQIILLSENKMRTHVDGMLKTHSYKDVMSLYRRYLTPRFHEKKHLGQVFTPFPLIEKILDQIPADVMTDPNSTFFDPSAGMGGFLVALYHRLMITLTKAIPDKKTRHEHIVSKMLFAAEITRNNVYRMKKIFGSRFHVFSGDSLTLTPEKMKKVFGVEKMRVIVGNPPFEKPQKKDTQKVAGDTLWIDFVEKSLDGWLMKGGYFGMLLPPGWRKPADEKSRNTGLWELMSVKNTPLWIEMYDAKETMESFNKTVSIRMDLVFLQKKKNKGVKTMIRGTDGKIYKENLKKYPFLPNAHFKYWGKVLTKNQEEGINVLYSSSVYESRKSSVKTKEDSVFKYPVIHSIHKDNSRVYLYTDKKEERGGFGVPKVVFNGYGAWNEPVLDGKGVYGMSQVIFGIPIETKKDGIMILNFFKNKNMIQMFENDLCWSTSTNFIFWKMFRNIKKDFYKL